MNIGGQTKVNIRKKIQLWKEQKGYLKKSITLVDLCAEFEINRTYMSNYINYTYQKNFNSWMNELRIKEAKKIMLSNPNLSLNEIAIMTGYTDLAHFSKQFKYHIGFPPSIWRKENKRSTKKSKGRIILPQKSKDA